ncbi:MAG TPA: hypothetical protein PLG05_01410 [Bacteroidales bacterium]|nr:hypothetical protein [Bacteroidales bacterium]HOR59815.1 hypothetical protein [Bacteroidales bacterium]HPL03813.1 hypothetical protein [Bacteroidales bacterium]
MNSKKIKHSYYFQDFECSPIYEPAVAYKLFFNEEESEVIPYQETVFRQLEKGLPFSYATSFKNQVHFQNAHLTPVQRWFPYREGYSERLVTSFINELNICRKVFDPFSGSGTTLLAARHNNLQSFGIDVNPISVLVAKVENEQYKKSDINDIKKEIKRLETLMHKSVEIETNFELAEKMFNTEILQSLLQFKNEIKSIDNSKIKNLFFVAWLSIIEEVSNIKKEGNGIKYKNRKRTSTGYLTIDKTVWESKNFPKNKFEFIKNKLIQRLNLILQDIENNYGAFEKKPHIFQADCLNFDLLFSDELQFTFFSPPYCNCFDYFEIHKVELWLGNFVQNKEQFKQLRQTGLRSNTNSLNKKPISYYNQEVETLINLFNEEKLWSKQIPNVIRGYFDDMHTLLKKLFIQTEKNGYVGIVVGNSAYSGVIIPTDVLIASIAQEVGFKVENIFITRHLTTSSQQKKYLEPLKYYLRESIVLLKK